MASPGNYQINPDFWSQFQSGSMTTMPVPNTPVASGNILPNQGTTPTQPPTSGSTPTGGTLTDMRSALTAIYQEYGLDPNNPGQGLANIDYFLNAAAGKGPTDYGYWTNRLGQEIQQWKGGGSGGGTGGGGGGGGTFMGGSYQLPPGAGFAPYQAPNFTAPAPFVAPTDVTMANDPGFQFRLKEGQRALENSAAAKGSILSGGTLKALDRYAQDYASGEYGNVFNRSLQGYNVNTANYWLPQELNAQYGLAGYQTNVATQRNAQLDYWNRLNTLYQGGQQAAADTYKTPPGF